MLGYSRDRTKYDELVYTCRGYSRQAVGAVQGIEHEETCPVGQDPDGVGTPFPSSTMELIRELVRKATRLYEQEDIRVKEIASQFEEIDGVRWTATGSGSRFAASLGRVSPRGEFHLESEGRRGVVVKIEPPTRTQEDYTPVSGNLDELYTWETAVKTETTKFFADILGCAKDGAWLAMEEAIPIRASIRRSMKERDMLYDDGREQYIDPLRGALLSEGWEDPDYKHGNIGLTEWGVPVMIDYGTGPDYTGENS